MKQLVQLVSNEITTTSDVVAKELGMAHNEMLKKLTKLASEIPEDDFNEMYTETFRSVKRVRYPNYTMNRDGYAFLLMNVSTKRAHEKKLAFIDAFNAMEKALLQGVENKDNAEWRTARIQTKAVRLEQTDVIKEFVEYATKQGSKNAKFYYKHVTNATYAALHLVQHKKPALRDTLDGMQLANLMVAENAAKASLRKHMAAGEHYKTVFLLVKADVEALAEHMDLVPIPKKVENG